MQMLFDVKWNCYKSKEKKIYKRKKQDVLT